MRLELKNRRGATMILVGLTLVAMIGFMAFALDFGRMYLYRSQVHVSADAAALAGVDTLAANGTGAAVQATAIAHGRLNLVEDTVPIIANADIKPVIWDFASASPTYAANWTTAGVNAVQATASHTAPYVFGRIFGLSSSLRTASSIAAIGFVQRTECVRPFSVSYETLLRGTNPPILAVGATYNPSYQLTAADVALIASQTSANPIPLAFVSPGQTGVPGNFAAVLLGPSLLANGTIPPWTPSNGGNYRSLIAAQCDDPLLQFTIGPGDWLDGDPGASKGQAAQGLATLCGLNINGNASFTCPSPVPIKMVLWNNRARKAGGAQACNSAQCSFQVNYVAAFYVTGWSSSLGVLGYFDTLASTGQLSSTPGPISKQLLVK